MEKKPKFTVLYEKLRGKSFEIDRDTMSIGRKDSADIQLVDGSVSSHHADIIRSEKNGEVCYILRDNDSTNGTKINNEPITEQVLKKYFHFLKQILEKLTKLSEMRVMIE